MTMTHSTFRREIEEIVAEINQLSQNLFIEKYVTLPKISIFRLELLNLFFYFASVPQYKRRSYCVTTGLVQLGLDIHETITNQKEYNDKEVRRRQLSILAGDYYSSQYYSLLSKNNLIDGVKKLAKGIRNINIAKMKLYTQNNGEGFQSMTQLVELIKVKESDLYIQFVDELNSSEHKILWKRIIEDFVLLFSLIDFPHLFVNHFANKSFFQKHLIPEKIEEMLQGLYRNIEERIQSIENGMVKGELLLLLDQFSHLLQQPINMVERS
ncbi:MAG: heptaprenyl diphosphate synthase component 1 [Tepidibacillus sp.]